MNEEELINFLKENLKIELSTYCDGGIGWAEDMLEITMYLKDKEISSSKISLS